MRIVLVDNRDSFTWNLFQLLSESGASCEVIPADASSVADVRRHRPDGIVLSPGPHGPEDASFSCEVLRTFHNHLPMLGVCLGHQCMGIVFGGMRSVGSAPAPIYGETSDVFHGGFGLFSGVPSPFPAARYHALTVRTVPDDFLPLAWTGEQSRPDVLMAMRHRTLPIFGVQFHPESFLTEGGSRIIKNFLSLCR